MKSLYGVMQIRIDNLDKSVTSDFCISTLLSQLGVIFIFVEKLYINGEINGLSISNISIKFV
jgi:hypothetical protein